MVGTEDSASAVPAIVVCMSVLWGQTLPGAAKSAPEKLRAKAVLGFFRLPVQQKEGKNTSLRNGTLDPSLDPAERLWTERAWE